ncbi:MAG: M24 family metallopeptidase, partial [Oscillospiraceae bacterium]
MNNENIRIEKLRKMLPKGFGAAIITTAENRFYFTGLDTSDAGTLIVFENDSYFIIDSRYIEICQRQNNGIVMTLQAKLYEQVTALLSKHNVKEVFLENKISIFEYNNFCKKVKANFFADDTLTNAIEALRMVKDEKELQNIFEAQEITDDAFNYILTEIKVGKTERELQLKLDYFMLTHGATGLAFDTILISGANTSLPHGVPSDKKIEKGDFVTM